MEKNCQRSKAENEEFLHSNTAHVEMQSNHDKVVVTSLAGGQCRSTQLDKKGKDVEADEYDTERACGDPNQFLFWKVEVDHATESHVDEGVDPWRWC